MADCPRPIQVCEPKTVTEGTSVECPDWEVCLPFGAKLYQKDGCVRFVAGTPPEDGVYGLITVENGCITALEEAEVPKYQSDPCAAVPCPCDSSEDSESAVCNPSTKTGNQYECDASGRPYAHAYVEGGDNVTVSGNGTSTNPYVISSSLGDSGVTSVRTETGAALEITTSDGTVTINHATGYNSQTINGMVFDQFGHLTDYDDNSASTEIIGVIGMNGVSAETNTTNGIVTVQLADPAVDLQGEWILGGYEMELDTKNQIYNLTRQISDTEGTYTFGNYDVTVNDYGSITEITRNSSSSTTSYALLSASPQLYTTEYQTPGYAYHSLIETTDESVTRHDLTFTMPYDARVVVDLYVASTDLSPTFYIDDEKHDQKLVLNGSAYTHVRLVPSGVLGEGEHTLSVRSSSGFPTVTPMSVQLTPVVPFDTGDAE